MSEPIGTDDWVECVQNRTPTTMPPIGLVVGCAYRVEAAGFTPPDDPYPNHPWVRVVGVPVRDGKLGVRLEWFKPIYRPKAELIQQLLAPPPKAKVPA